MRSIERRALAWDANAVVSEENFARFAQFLSTQSQSSPVAPAPVAPAVLSAQPQKDTQPAVLVYMAQPLGAGQVPVTAQLVDLHELPLLPAQLEAPTPQVGPVETAGGRDVRQAHPQGLPHNQADHRGPLSPSAQSTVPASQDGSAETMGGNSDKQVS